MKTKNNKQRLKTYKIKAVNYTDAVKEYNKHIIKDASQLVETIGDYTIRKNNDDFLKFAVFYKGQIIAETTTVAMAKKEIKSHGDGAIKDSWTETYKQFEALVDKYFPNTKAINEAVETLYKQHKGQADWDEAYKRWKSITKDSSTEDEQLKYQTTFRGEESQDIRLSEGSCYCNYDKTSNTTHVIFMGGQRNQPSRDFTIRGKITTVEQLKKEIDKHLKYLSSNEYSRKYRGK